MMQVNNGTTCLKTAGLTARQIARLVGIFLFAFAMLALFGTASASTYYVDLYNQSGPCNDFYDKSINDISHPFCHIQKGANVSLAGDTILVMNGSYDERIATMANGNPANYITFKASGRVVTRGFVLQNNYTTIDGFEMTRHNALFDGFLKIRRSANYCKILNNVIRDGTAITAGDFVFAHSVDGTDSITSNAADFVAAGFEKDIEIKISSNATIANTGRYMIKDVTSHSLTLYDNSNLTNEGPVFAYIRVEVSGIYFSSGGDFPENSSSDFQIVNNTISNIYGTSINICGRNHLIENNTITHTNGYDLFIVFGKNHTIRNNFIYDGNRIEGNPTHADIIQTFGDNGVQSYNIRFEHNFVKDYDAQIGQLEGLCYENAGCNATMVRGNLTSFGLNFITDTSQNWKTNFWKDQILIVMSGNARKQIYLILNNSQDTIYLRDYGGAEADLASDGINTGDSYLLSIRVGWYNFTDNVFDNVGQALNIGIPFVKLNHNIFFNTTKNTGNVMGFGCGGRGCAIGGNASNNFFIGSGGSPTNTKYGFYGLEADATGSTADYNYVTGLPSYNYPPKSTTTLNETHGINGGNPMFWNIYDSLGPDRTPFTSDDGLIPMQESQACHSSDNGSSIGPYACKACSDNAPMPYILTDKEDGYETLSVLFNATSSESCSSGISRYHWDFGDGTSSESPIAIHRFENGTYNVKLTVTNDLGLSSSANKTITSFDLLESGIVLYLNMNSTARDSSKRLNDGRWVGNESFMPGVIDRAAGFDGRVNGSYILVPYKRYMDGMESLSIAFWAKRNEINSSGVIIFKQSSYYYQLDMNGFSARIYNSTLGYPILTSLTGGNDLKWHLYALVYNRTAATLYYDGVSNITRNFSGSIKEFSSSIYMGKDPWHTVINGSVDELKVYERALNAAEIQDMYRYPTASPGSSSPEVSAYVQEANISWQTDKNADGSILYGRSILLGESLRDGDYAKAHTFTLASLLPDTTYFYNVSSCDLFGNCNISGVYNFTTLAPVCGDGIVQPGEECETDADANGLLCSDFGDFNSGSLDCMDCRYVTTNCIKIAVCGDGVQEPGEECDYGPLLYNSSSARTRCGDGYPGSLDPDAYYACTESCMLDTTNCSLAGVCGDGSVSADEDCEPGLLISSTCVALGFDGGLLSCSSSCRYNTSGCTMEGVCGNGIVEPQNNEECDLALGTLQCSDFGDFNSGSLDCIDCRYVTTNCSKVAICGDGVAELGEECDYGPLPYDPSLSRRLCRDGYPQSVNPTAYYICTDTCTLDTTNCSLPGICGDGSVTGDEECEPGMPLNSTCADMGFDSGTLSCSQSCRYDTSDCIVAGSGDESGGTGAEDEGGVEEGREAAVCGNGIVEPENNEECDGSAGLMQCSDFGFSTGALVCTDCVYDTSNCSRELMCGDGICQSDESCSTCPGDCRTCVASYSASPEAPHGGSRVIESLMVSAVDIGEEGVTRKMLRGSKLQFKYKGVLHGITVNRVNKLGDSAEITIESAPQTYEVKRGSSIRLDLDGDGVDDIRITMDDIGSLSYATITVKLLPQPKPTMQEHPTSSRLTTKGGGEAKPAGEAVGKIKIGSENSLQVDVPAIVRNNTGHWRADSFAEWAVAVGAGVLFLIVISATIVAIRKKKGMN